MKLKGPHGRFLGSPRVGDVVLMKENLPQGRWKVGRICELIKGADNHVISAKVTVATHKFLRRPLSLLYPIECPNYQDNPVNVSQVDDNSVASSDDNESEKICQDDDITEDNSTEDHRPTRKATVVARQRLKQWLKPDAVLILSGSVVDHASEN